MPSWASQGTNSDFSNTVTNEVGWARGTLTGPTEDINILSGGDGPHTEILKGSKGVGVPCPCLLLDGTWSWDLEESLFHHQTVGWRSYKPEGPTTV